MAKTTVQKNETATAKASLKTGTKLGTGAKVKGAVAKKPAAKPAKAPKEKGQGRVGADLPYTVVSKDNPFREGTIRAELWAHIKASKSTGAARALDSRISSAFMQDLADKEVIKFS